MPITDSMVRGGAGKTGFFWMDDNGTDSINDTEYHGRRDLVGSSMLGTLLEDPNAYYWQYEYIDPNTGKIGHPGWTEKPLDFDDKKDLEKRVLLDYGSAVHAELLKPSTSPLVILKKPERVHNKKFYTDNPGKFIVPVVPSYAGKENWGMFEHCVKAARENPYILKMIENETENEKAYVFKDPYGFDIDLKVKFDIFRQWTEGKRKGRHYFADIKTVRNKPRKMIFSDFATSKYPLQAALYAEGMADATGEYPEGTKDGYTGIFYIHMPKVNEFCAPFVWELPTWMLEEGRLMLRQAVERLAWCRSKGFNKFTHRIEYPSKSDFRPSIPMDEHDDMD